MQELARAEGTPSASACDAGNLVRRFRRRPFAAETSLSTAQRLTEKSEFIPGTMFQGVQPIQ
ncbi:MAG: hypothetical protein DMG77_12550 [Acidobacteria bacterium]|nr:MAG: hypothetical protein DMG77_12550 [Acidobacteriota bacterium]